MTHYTVITLRSCPGAAWPVSVCSLCRSLSLNLLALREAALTGVALSGSGSSLHLRRHSSLQPIYRCTSRNTQDEDRASLPSETSKKTACNKVDIQ